MRSFHSADIQNRDGAPLVLADADFDRIAIAHETSRATCASPIAPRYGYIRNEYFSSAQKQPIGSKGRKRSVWERAMQTLICDPRISDSNGSALRSGSIPVVGQPIFSVDRDAELFGDTVNVKIFAGSRDADADLWDSMKVSKATLPTCCR